MSVGCKTLDTQNNSLTIDLPEGGGGGGEEEEEEEQQQQQQQDLDDH
jgi:hypothetical protein